MKDMKIIVQLTGTLLLLLLLGSCPSPLNEEKLLLVTDEIPPVITVTSPVQNSYYSSLVEVSGTVTDSLDTSGVPGIVSEISWSLEPSYISGERIEVTDSQFDFSFSTTGFTGSVILSIHAEDQNGNTSSSSVTLNQAGNEIPSFEAEAGNGSVTLMWEDVPGAIDYNVYYSTDGSVPGPQFGSSIQSITSPYLLSGLENGSRHVFLLEAVGSTFVDTSDYIEVIPLGEFTLAPDVEQLDSSIRISWSPIPGADTFEVWRSNDSDGPYILINGSCMGNSYIDTHIEPSSRYFYKIALVHGNDTLSVFGTGETNIFISRGFKSNYMMTYGSKVMVPHGDALYVESTGGQVITFDISNPGEMRRTDNTGFNSVTGSRAGSGDISISGDLLLFAGHSNGFHSIDVSDPLYPVELDMLPNASEIPVNSLSDHVAIDGSFAYVALSESGEYRIEQIDLSVPSSLSVTNTLTISSYCWDLISQDGYLYVMAQDQGILVFDLSEFPDSPPVATIPLPAGESLSRNIRIIGAYLYAVYADTGIQIVDLSSPESPGPASILPPPEGGTISDFIISEKYGYAACQDNDSEDALYGGGIHIYDAADPSAPSYIAPFYSQGSYSISLAQKEDNLFVSQTYGLGVVSLSRRSPAGAKDVPGGPLNAGLQNRSVIPVGEYYIASSDSGMEIAHKDSPYTVTAEFPYEAYVSERGTAEGAYAVKGNYLFGSFRDTNEWDRDFRVYDMSNPENPQLLFDDENTFPDIDRFALHGEYIYGNNDQYITAVNIANPDSPFIAGNTFIDIPVSSIVPVGDYLFAGSTSQSEVYILDYTDRKQGEVIDVLELAEGTRVTDMSRSGDFIFCVHDTPGITVINVSDPQNPIILEKAGISALNDYISELGHQYQRIRIEGAYAYCSPDSSLTDSYVDIIDIRSTYQPSFVRSIDARNVQSCAVDGNRLYIVEYDSGIRALDLWEIDG